MSAQDEYDKNRPFGKAENIEKRLAMWANGLGSDRSLPWVGLGLIDDLKQACRMLGGDPDTINPDMRKSMRSLAIAAPNPAPAETVEYDL